MACAVISSALCPAALIQLRAFVATRDHSSARALSLLRKKATQRAVAHTFSGTVLPALNGDANSPRVVCKAMLQSHDPSNDWSSSSFCRSSLLSHAALI